MLKNWVVHLLLQNKFYIAKVNIRAKWPIRPEFIPVSVAWSDQDHFNATLDGMLVHSQGYPQHLVRPGTHLCIGVQRGTVRVTCLAQEHHTMSPPGLETGRTVRPGVERTNHETTAPPVVHISKVNIQLKTETLRSFTFSDFISTINKIAFELRKENRKETNVLPPSKKTSENSNLKNTELHRVRVHIAFSSDWF